MFTIADISQELQLDGKALRRLIRRHRIPTTRDGRRYLVDQEGYDRLMVLTHRTPTMHLPPDAPGRPLRELEKVRHDKTLKAQHLALYKRRQERLLTLIKEAGL